MPGGIGGSRDGGWRGKKVEAARAGNKENNHSLTLFLLATCPGGYQI